MTPAPSARKDIRLVLQQVTNAAANLPIVGSPPEVTPNARRASSSASKGKR